MISRFSVAMQEPSYHGGLGSLEDGKLYYNFTNALSPYSFLNYLFTPSNYNYIVSNTCYHLLIQLDNVYN
jgi:hypothetical protein